MSKTKKIRLMRKNWILKGKWLVDIGSNPHSNGDIFSWSMKDFFEMKIFKDKSKIEIIRAINIIVIIIVIIYIKLVFKYFNWKLNVIYLYYINNNINILESSPVNRNI